jgi:hypothetical protein
MAETSRFWTTNGTGDGSSGGYTQAQFAEFVRQTLMTSLTTEGVLKGIGNELAVSGTSSPLTVASGSGLVYGLFYANNSSITGGTELTIPTPSTATRIDRIVLRASWAAQTVRVFRIAGTEGLSAPALTHIENITWDIPLATVSITTNGVITVTDGRTFVKTPGTFGYLDDSSIINAAQLATSSVTTAKIADLNVTEGKLATSAVTVTKIGAGAVTSAKLAADAVVTTSIINDAVTGAKIASTTITADNIVLGTITGNRIASTTVTGGAAGNIALTTITADNIAANAITNAKILDGAVTGGVTAGVATGSIAVNTIVGGTTGNISSGTITADNIALGTITGARIASTTITGGAAGNIALTTITGGTTGNISSGTITAYNIAANTITANEIFNGTIGSDELAGSSVIEAKIGTGAVTVNKIGAGAVTSAKLAPGAVVTTSILDDAVTGTKIASQTITGAAPGNIAPATITDFNIATNTITGQLLGNWALRLGGRQGGGAANWNESGASIWENPLSNTGGGTFNRVQMCVGTCAISLSAASSGTTNVTFSDVEISSGDIYAAQPIVIATPYVSQNYIVDVSYIDVNNATIRVTHRDGTSATTTVYVMWIAIGATGI